MLKAYPSVVLFAALLYPIVWYLITREGFDMVFGYWPLGLGAAGITSVTALTALLIMKSLFNAKGLMFDGFLLRIGAALLAGFMSAAGIYAYTAVVAGVLPGFGPGWWELMIPTAFVASLLSYWFTNFLVKSVTPL